MKGLLYKPESEIEMQYFERILKLQREKRGLLVEIGKLQSEIDHLNFLLRGSKESKLILSKKKLIADRNFWQRKYFDILKTTR
jgi:hypothetical protein